MDRTDRVWITLWLAAVAVLIGLTWALGPEGRWILVVVILRLFQFG